MNDHLQCMSRVQVNDNFVNQGAGDLLVRHYLFMAADSSLNLNVGFQNLCKVPNYV